MKFLRKFNEHTSYEAEVNVGGDFKSPNVSYCKDVKDVHFNPYNLIKFYVGKITEPQTVKIYTDSSNSIDVTVSNGNKWYSYLLPKDKGLYTIKGNNSDVFSDDIITKVIVKANISYSSGTFTPIIPSSIIEAYFKCSNTSNITDMGSMFFDCKGLTSLDLSGWNTSKVTRMNGMFSSCARLTSLDVSSFKTSSVTNMNQMFNNCSGLTSLDLRNFNTSNVTSMYDMFNGCRSPETLDLSGWDMSKVTDTTRMFDGCSNSLSIRMKGCNKTTIDKITAVKPSGASISTE